MKKAEYLPKEWQDSRGGNIAFFKGENSENPTTGNAAYHFMFDQLCKLTVNNAINLLRLITEKYSTNFGRFLTNSNDVGKNERFSLDELVSGLAMCRWFGFIEPMKHFELVSKQTWYRFNDVIMYGLLAKYNLSKYLFFIPQLFVICGMILSSRSKESDTSGKQLNYIRMEGMKDKSWMRGTFKLTRLKVDYIKNFKIFYHARGLSHPIAEMGEELFSEKN
tara:strand:+ start:32846 stop:33508 length:663 start_codon:yes stop_codon:yes gene_type:complete